MRLKYEVADVIKNALPKMNVDKMLFHHQRTLNALTICRTAALGQHVDGCDSCGHLRISYNSCRNRHCPKCQGLKKEMWIVQQEEQLLGVAYFHVVFTLPHELNAMCLNNPNFMYDLLFKAAWHTLNILALDEQWLGAKTAATMVLHTWSQTMSLHPHVHCIVPNGGLTKAGKWQFPKRGNGNFLFPVVAMQSIYRGFFMDHLKTAIQKNEVKLKLPKEMNYQQLKNELYGKTWVIYTKKPFSGVKNVVNYLGRYSHRIAITNHRLQKVDLENVLFGYKDYRQNGRRKQMRLSNVEFVRRFCLHILPPNFRKVRQYGYLANPCKAKYIKLARSALGHRVHQLRSRAERKKIAKERLFGKNVHKCPICKTGNLNPLGIIPQNKAPPEFEGYHPFENNPFL